MTRTRIPLFALDTAARLWFLVTLAGQLIFGAYIVALYGGAITRGDPARWNAVMTHGHVVGATAGNAAVAVHLLLAAVIMLGGALQLVPGLRTALPRLHRYNGRMYLLGAVLAAISGLYMMWWRGAVGDLIQHIGTSINALLVLLCAYQALRHALARRIDVHRRWALRLFLCVSGVWFFRVGLMCWIALNGGPAGFDPATFTGPALSVLAYAQYLAPLLVLEAYLCARRSAQPAWQVAAAALVMCSTGLIAVGVAVATVGMWLPQLVGGANN